MIFVVNDIEILLNHCYCEQSGRSGIRFHHVAGLLALDGLFNFSLQINSIGSDIKIK